MTIAIIRSSLHYVRDAAAKVYVRRITGANPPERAMFFEAFKAGWDAREAAQRASILEEPS